MSEQWPPVVLECAAVAAEWLVAGGAAEEGSSAGEGLPGVRWDGRQGEWEQRWARLGIEGVAGEGQGARVPVVGVGAGQGPWEGVVAGPSVGD